MEMLAQLAKDGRTVMVVTHSVANLASCDRLLVLVPGGKVAYFGTPADGLRHFGHDDWAEVFQDFEAQPDRDWAADYRRSAYYARYTSGPLQALGAAAGAARRQRGPRRRRSRRRAPASRLAQLSTLVRRYVSVIASDRNYVGVIALLPVILGGLIRAIPDAGRPGRPEQRPGHPAAAHPGDERLPDRRRQRRQGTGQGTGDLHQGTRGGPVARRLPCLQARRPRRHQRRPVGRARRHRPGRPPDARRAAC